MLCDMAAKHPNASFRLMLSSVVGLVLALVLPRSWPWEARVMLGWAAVIAAVLFVGIAPMFLGLFVALPVLGHASWHIYRRLFPDD